MLELLEMADALFDKHPLSQGNVLGKNIRGSGTKKLYAYGVCVCVCVFLDCFHTNAVFTPCPRHYQQNMLKATTWFSTDNRFTISLLLELQEADPVSGLLDAAIARPTSEFLGLALVYCTEYVE